MTIVVDANIIFSALITPNGKIAKILANPLSTVDFISGHLLVEELLRHQSKIALCSKRAEKDILENMQNLLKTITLYDEGFTQQDYWRQAEILTNEVDHFDVSYVALSLQHDAILWTGDKKLTNHLKLKGFNKIISTSELYEKLQIG